jgi:transposase
MERSGYDHQTVNHELKEYVRGDIHTNTIEAFWANVKRSIRGTCVWTSTKHLQKYLWKFEYRHNLRHIPYLMFDVLLYGFSHVRLALPWPAKGGQNPA